MTRSLKSKTIDVSLTSFADFLMKGGRSQITAVRQFRQQYEQGYQQGFDYYKRFRDGVRAFHREGLLIDSLHDLAKTIEPKSKKTNYELLARGYSKFWARSFQELGATSIDAPKSSWTYGDLNVRINPEVALQSGSETYFIKLYNKKDALKKLSLDVVLHLMQHSLSDVCERPVICMLDVRRGRLFEATNYDSQLQHLLEAQSLAFCHLWRSFDIDDPELLTT